MNIFYQFEFHGLDYTVAYEPISSIRRSVFKV
jgi:hypothetical protein